jgi:methyl coenzyme M reductase subunit C-like uncharacterized protein (methanogenesis marker protein 7)
MIGLARGMGSGLGYCLTRNGYIINEHDLRTVSLWATLRPVYGRRCRHSKRDSSSDCRVWQVHRKRSLCGFIDPPVAGYSGGLGRFMHRTKEPHELALLDEIVREVSRGF